MAVRTITLPESLLSALDVEMGASEVPRWIVETMVVEAVREGVFSVGRAGEILGAGYFDTLALLNRRGVTVEISDEATAQDRRDLRRMFPDLTSQ